MGINLNILFTFKYSYMLASHFNGKRRVVKMSNSLYRNSSLCFYNVKFPLELKKKYHRIYFSLSV